MTREEAINRLESLIKWGNLHEIDVDACKIAIEALKQEPKTGHWILDDSDNSITCERCGCNIYANDIGNGEPNYCPNCGARMESKATSGESYPGEFEVMEHNGRMDAIKGDTE